MAPVALTPEYREQRAVAAFNASMSMLQEYKRLKPNAEAAVCHVAACLIPRQVRHACACILASP